MTPGNLYKRTLKGNTKLVLSDKVFFQNFMFVNFAVTYLLLKKKIKIKLQFFSLFNETPASIRQRDVMAFDALPRIWAVVEQ